jgi:hypothetical protein
MMNDKHVGLVWDWNWEGFNFSRHLGKIDTCGLNFGCRKGQMDIWKQRVWNLEKKVHELTERIDSSQKAAQQPHFVTFDKETGQISLEELDTFRFVVREMSQNQNPSYKYSYEFRNPTDELLERIKREFPNQSRQYGPIYIRSSNPPETVEGDDIEMIVTILVNGNNSIEHRISLKKDIKSLLHAKQWAFSKDNTFIQTFTIPFKNSYKILPHTFFFVTPFKDSNITYTLTNLTCKNMSIKVQYGSNDIAASNSGWNDAMYLHNDVPPTTTIHWLVQGVVESSNLISELLD